MPDAYEAIRRLLLTTDDVKLIKDLSRMILEGAGHLREEGQIGGQIIIKQSDVQLLIQGAKEVLGYVDGGKT